jgi:hypothetical protein
MASGFIFLRFSYLIKPLVASLSRNWTLTTSLSLHSKSRLATVRTPASFARASVLSRPQTHTGISNACA